MSEQKNQEARARAIDLLSSLKMRTAHLGLTRDIQDWSIAELQSFISDVYLAFDLVDEQFDVYRWAKDWIADAHECYESYFGPGKIRHRTYVALIRGAEIINDPTVSDHYRFKVNPYLPSVKHKSHGPDIWFPDFYEALPAIASGVISIKGVGRKSRMQIRKYIDEFSA